MSIQRMACEKWAGFTDEDIKNIKGFEILKDEYSEQPAELKDTDKELDNFTQNIVSKCNLTYPDLQDFPNDVSANEADTEKSIRLCEKSIETINEQNFCDLPTKDLCENNVCVNNNLQDLEMFEMRQKRIEKENIRRRALITKAITDKKLQTQAETIKLAKITGELQKLDSILSADVSILRNYIEKASYEFSEAEKRYLKAEREFIESKLYLYEKMQRKEQLTEHLCAIIEQNENRKANKLVELMKQLEMETIIDDCGINDSDPILSKLCILNDEAYHCCQTLKPSQITDGSKQCEELPNTYEQPASETGTTVSSIDEIQCAENIS